MNNIAAEHSQQPKLSGALRPLVGAFLGVLVFLMILLPVKLFEEKSIILVFISLDLELLGRMIVGAVGAFAGIDLPEGISSILSITISAVPPAILVRSSARMGKQSGLPGLFYW